MLKVGLSTPSDISMRTHIIILGGVTELMRANNKGWRIDYLMATQEMSARLSAGDFQCKTLRSLSNRVRN